MEDLKISQLPILESISGQELFHVAKNGEDYAAPTGYLLKKEDTSNLLLFDSGEPTSHTISIVGGVGTGGMRTIEKAIINKIYNASSLYFSCDSVPASGAFEENGKIVVMLQNADKEMSVVEVVIPPTFSGTYLANVQFATKINNPILLQIEIIPAYKYENNIPIFVQGISHCRMSIGTPVDYIGWEENPQYANSRIESILKSIAKA